MRKENTHIPVTGGAGFIDSFVVDHIYNISDPDPIQEDYSAWEISFSLDDILLELAGKTTEVAP